MTETSNDTGIQTLHLAFNGRRFARKAAEYCSENGLQCAWRNTGAIPSFMSMTNFDVAGTPEQLRAFVAWGDRIYPRAGFSANFEGDDFMQGRTGPDLS